MDVVPRTMMRQVKNSVLGFDAVDMLINFSDLVSIDALTEADSPDVPLYDGLFW